MADAPPASPAPAGAPAAEAPSTPAPIVATDGGGAQTPSAPATPSNASASAAVSGGARVLSSDPVVLRRELDERDRALTALKHKTMAFLEKTKAERKDFDGKLKAAADKAEADARVIAELTASVASQRAAISDHAQRLAEATTKGKTTAATATEQAVRLNASTKANEQLRSRVTAVEDELKATAAKLAAAEQQATASKATFESDLKRLMENLTKAKTDFFNTNGKEGQHVTALCEPVCVLMRWACGMCCAVRCYAMVVCLLCWQRCCRRRRQS
jgi:hypothetical protein